MDRDGHRLVLGGAGEEKLSSKSIRLPFVGAVAFCLWYAWSVCLSNRWWCHYIHSAVHKNTHTEHAQLYNSRYELKQRVVDIKCTFNRLNLQPERGANFSGATIAQQLDHFDSRFLAGYGQHLHSILVRSTHQKHRVRNRESSPPHRSSLSKFVPLMGKLFSSGPAHHHRFTVTNPTGRVLNESSTH